jgi:hypothetical protein
MIVCLCFDIYKKTYPIIAVLWRRLASSIVVASIHHAWIPLIALQLVVYARTNAGIAVINRTFVLLGQMIEFSQANKNGV